MGQRLQAGGVHGVLLAVVVARVREGERDGIVRLQGVGEIKYHFPLIVLELALLMASFQGLDDPATDVFTAPRPRLLAATCGMGTEDLSLTRAAQSLLRLQELDEGRNVCCGIRRPEGCGQFDREQWLLPHRRITCCTRVVSLRVGG